MTEKVIQEIKLIETEDGYRLEVKGDKEQLQKMGFGPGMMRFFGPRMRRKGHKRHGHKRHGHHGHGRSHHHSRHGRRGFGPWAWHHEETDAEHATKTESKTA